METILTLTETTLASLSISPLNVRKSNLTEDIKALAADIHAHGLKQNLVVVPSEVPGRYRVVAGGRRLQALHHLVDEGLLDYRAPIPVRVEAIEEGRPTSLSENLHRVAMNPADEFEAYRTIVADHAGDEDPIGYCARRFAVSRAHVEGRLRLAGLASDILDALRAGTLGVEGAKAYAAFEDHDLQLKVFAAEERKTYGSKHDPRAVRDALKSKTLPIDCPQATYVGLDAYRAAGGRTEREMFMGQEDAERIIDPLLLDKLAREKIAADVAVRAKKDGFDAALPAVGFGQYPSWPKAPDGQDRDYVYRLELDTLTKADRKLSTAVYQLASDGTGLEFYGRFKPAKVQAQAAPVDHVAAQRERYRQERIVARAARLAIPDLTSTPLDGLVEFDDDDFVGQDDDDVYWLNVRIKVTPEQLEAHRAEAEAAIAREAAEEAAAEAAAAQQAEQQPADV